MDNMIIKRKDLMKKIEIGRPHLVLLGAGASRAAFPNGDKNGIQLPLMNDLFNIIDLEFLIEKYNIDVQNDNFEEFFSNLYEREDNKIIANEVEKEIFNFFKKLELPEEPTIYDYLVLSLRKKDVIATFNWDPFLWLAARRNYGVVDLPHLIFLHGNVVVGYCHNCKIKGQINYECPQCGQLYTPSHLLYPVKKKDYDSDPAIAGEWTMIKEYMKHAYIFSIFGYSAPTTDIEAMNIFKTAWGGTGNRNFEQIEFIHKPNSSEDDVINPWKDFIHSHHYDITDDFFKSIMSRYPRRTCDAFWAATMEVRFVENNYPPKNVDLITLQNWFRKFKEYEN